MAKKYTLSVIIRIPGRIETMTSFVAELTEREMNDLGAYGLERMARQEAAILGGEYVDFAT